MARVWLSFELILLLACGGCGSTTSQPGNYKIALVPSRMGQRGIFVMNSDTSGGRLLTSDPNVQLRQGSWSPDGSRIAYFTTRREDGGMMNKYPIPQHSPLYVVEAAGANPKRLLNYPVSSFGWSPDSRKLVVVSAYEDPGHSDSAIYVVDLQTGEQRRMTSFGKNCSAAWSPEGTHLALSLGDGRSSDIYVTTLDAHGRRLTDSQTIAVGPVWSPNGKKIAYTVMAAPGTDSKDAGIYVIDADGTQKKCVTNLSTYGVSWAPDGTKLLLQVIGAVYLVDAEGGNPVKVRVPTNNLLDATFSPDGEEVMFRSNYEGDWNLYAVDLKNEKCRRLTEQLTAFMFCFSPLLNKH